MAFEPLKTNTIDIKKNKGTSYEGYFMGFEVIKTKLGDQTVWKFKGKADGMPFGIYGFTNLNYSMKAAPAGALLRVTYTGTKKMDTKFGLKDVHQCEVMIDKDDVLEHPSVEEKADEQVPF